MESSPMVKHSGADWLREALTAKKRRGKEVPQLGEFGARVADLLGQAWLGIYHLPNSALFHERTDWSNERYIVVVVRGGTCLATYDYARLTLLVLLAHRMKIRLEIDGAAQGYVRLLFHPRKSRLGKLWERHPTVEQAIADLGYLLPPEEPDPAPAPAAEAPRPGGMEVTAGEEPGGV